MLEKQSIFPIQVFRAQFGNAEELRKAVVPELLAKEKSDQQPIKYTANGYTSYGRENILDNPLFEELKQFIDQAVKLCHQETNLLGEDNIKLASSWFSINRKYTYHEEHTHLPDVWSGVYYIQSDQKHPSFRI